MFYLYKGGIRGKYGIGPNEGFLWWNYCKSVQLHEGDSKVYDYANDDTELYRAVLSQKYQKCTIWFSPLSCVWCGCSTKLRIVWVRY